MHPNPRKIIPIVIILALASLAIWYFGIHRAEADNGNLSASGTVEAVQVRISPELGGRVAEVRVSEGDSVKAGDVLVRIDSTLLGAQRLQAEAAVKVAKANAAAAQATADGAMANASSVQALLTAAQAGLAAAEGGLEAAQANLKLLEAGPSEEQLKVAQTVIDKARIAADAAQEAYDAIPKELRDSPDGKALKQQLDLANAAVANAQAQYDLIKAGAPPEQLEAAKAQVSVVRAQVDAAQAQVDSAQAMIKLAQAQAEAAQNMAQAAQAQAEAAQAALNLLDVQIAKLTLTAPIDGVILSCSIQPGEVATPGATLLVLSRLTDLTITVYVPEDNYGAINLGQTAAVTIDSFPNVTFVAQVVHIADKAEFTPRNVQTSQGRRSTVFAVKLALSNPEGKLKPGMPADVTFGK
jgi:HlyD family secretion protein